MYIETVPATIEQGNTIRQQILDDMAAVLCRNPETLTNPAACELALTRARFSSGAIAMLKHRAMEAAAGPIPAQVAKEAPVAQRRVRHHRSSANVDRVSRALGKLAIVMAQVRPGSDFLLVSCSHPLGE